MTAKAIETVYNGYKFRSRLEARWAVFFDTLGIKYEYEKEGYDLDGIWYLPDFWLPEQEYWIEIKGREATETEHIKALRLALNCANPPHPQVHIFEGDIKIPDLETYPTYAHRYLYRSTEVWHGSPTFCWFECSACGRFIIAYDWSFTYKIVPGTQVTGCPFAPNVNAYLNFASPRLMAAYTAARQARFEHKGTGVGDDLQLNILISAKTSHYERTV